MSEICKVRHDGSHYIAIPYTPLGNVRIVRESIKTAFSLFFDDVFTEGLFKGLKGDPHKEYIYDRIKENYGEDYVDLEIIDKLFHNKMKALRERINRFYSIAYLNKWTHFVTFTYDNKKHTEESFEKKLRKTLQNLHTRYNWLYAGVFEKSPEEERKHFHGLFNVQYIPGEIYEKKDYSFKIHDIQITHCNTFFEDRFGRNDFEVLNESDLINGNAIGYITKYIIKQNQKVVYSRGLNSPKYCEIDEEDISSQFNDGRFFYVLYDDFDFYDKREIKVK